MFCSAKNEKVISYQDSIIKTVLNWKVFESASKIMITITYNEWKNFPLLNVISPPVL